MSGADWKHLFILIFPRAPQVEKIDLRGYAGRYGRLDIYARSILLAQHYSNIIGEPVGVVAVLPGREDFVLLEYYSSIAQSTFFGGEREAMLYILKSILDKNKKYIDKKLFNSFEDCCGYFKKICKRAETAYFTEDGVDIANAGISIGTPLCSFLGAHLDPPKQIIDSIVTYFKEIKRVSIDSVSLLATHVISYVLETLDES